MRNKEKKAKTVVKRRTKDLTVGPIAKNLMVFVLPLIFTNLLQQLYTVADRIVVGQFAQNGAIALAAVGSTGSATALLVTLFNGLASGVSIVCANLRGAREQEKLRTTMHTSLVLSAISGAFLLVVGVLFARKMLVLMNVPKDMLEMACLYVRLYFLGVPASLLYNAGSAMLRAHGDSRRPMIVLSVSGLANVALNLVLVIGFRMSVAGVAIATVTSQVISAVWILSILFSKRDVFRLRVQELRIHKAAAKQLLVVAIPCGINGIAFCFPNMVLQATVNIFGTEVVAGNVATDSITVLLIQVMAAFYSATVSFVGQNFGAKNYKRVDRTVLISNLYSCGIVIGLSVLCMIFSDPLMALFNDDPEVIKAGTPKLNLYCTYCALYAASQVLLGAVRGLKKTLVPSIINISTICGIRILWILLIFPLRPTADMVYWCYPISWACSFAGLLAAYFYYRKKLFVE